MKCPKCGFNMSKDMCIHCGYSERNQMKDVGKNNKEKKYKSHKTCKMLVIIGLFLMILGVFYSFFGNKINFNSKNVVGLFKNQISSLEIEPTVLYDDNNILININSISSDSYDYIINYNIKNKNDFGINVDITGPYINDIYVPFKLLDKLGANDKKDGSFVISKDELSKNKIFDIMSISFPIEITTSTGDIIDRSAYKKVKTNKYDSNIQNYNLGKVVYEDDKVQIQYLELIDKPLTNNKKNKQLRLFVHNKTDGAVKMGIESKNIFINNEKHKIDFSNVIPAKKYGINEYNFTFDKISNIHTIKLNCSYYDLNTHNLISNADYFEIKIK